LPPPPPERKSAVSTAILNAGVQKKQEASQSVSTPPSAARKEARKDKVRYSPAVLRLAQEHDIALDQVTGTGEGGRITRKDLLKLIETGNIPTATSAAPAPAA
ncbi:MAG TPA: branched-chain alpha-keto acid dehydrogenase subunit E2, partial [Lysinibacillus sp.]|nr:branched-chain alpha-keto acid dehydrogenase subunit E2 [Lysinibacillus sp.]